MESYDKYGQLRDRCLQHWNMHRDVSGSVADLWHKVGSAYGELSAVALFGDAVDLIDIQRREIEAARRVIRALMPQTKIVQALRLDDVIAAELLSERSQPNKEQS